MPRIEPNGLQARLVPVHARVLPVRRRACKEHIPAPNGHGVVSLGDSHCEPTHRPLASAREPRAEPHGPLARLVPCMRASCLYGGVHAHMHRPTFAGRCHHAINSRCELACRPLACAIFKSRATWASCPACALHARILPLRRRACTFARLVRMPGLP